MPPTLTSGAAGDSVRVLQSKLNLFSTALPRLAADGKFGPKTLVRVREFQSQNSLVSDGIVGPKTWAKLNASVSVNPRTGILCGNSDESNAARVLQIAANFLSVLARTSAPKQASAGTTLAAFPSPLGFPPIPSFPSFPSLPSLPSLPSSPFARLTPSQIAVASGRYGSSIDFSRVFLSTFVGAQNRPFTAAIPIPAGLALLAHISGTIQVMNVGTFSPSNRLLLHELAHVWQSQHDSVPTRFMTNSLACQGAAIALNKAEQLVDPTLPTVGGDDFPFQFPNAAYCYTPGKPFSQYSCEQMANNLDHGDPAITAQVRAAPANSVHADNVAGLSKVSIADRRVPGNIF